MRKYLAVLATVLFVLIQHLGMRSQAAAFAISTHKLMAGMVLILLFLGLASLWSIAGKGEILSFSCALTILFSYYNTYQFLFEAQKLDGGSHALLYMGAAMAILLVTFLAARQLFALVEIQGQTEADILYYGIAGATVLLMVLNLILGRTSGASGARLWIQIGPLSFQPGELAKVALIFLGSLCYRQRSRIRVGIYLAVNLFVCLALVILSDYGNIFVIFAVLLLMIYLLTDNRLLSLTLVLGCLGVFFLMLRFVPYAQQRLANWGTAMESGTSTQQRQIMEAVIFGGLKGIQVQRFDYLGRIYAASCDCALAGIWALNGPMALLLLLGAYAGVVYQAASVYAFRPSNYLILIQSGFVIFVQVVLNLMGTLDVLPFTGVVAPLVSSGGSAMCTFGMLLGMAMASLDPVIPAMAAEPVHSQNPFVWEEE